MVKNCHYFFSSTLSITQYSVLILLLSLVLFVLYSRYLARNSLESALMLMILVEGNMNTLERWITGCVKDPLNFFDLFWFNVYDISVTVGVSILIGLQIFYHGKSSTNSRR